MAVGITERQLEAIAETLELTQQLGVEVWLRGGWAMDFFLGEITRDHVDVDWFAWSHEAARLAAALTDRGYTLLADPPHDQQLDLVRADVELSFALLARDKQERVVVAGGPWAGEPWPDGMLDGGLGQLGGLRCPIIEPGAQIEIKQMMPVWVPGRPRRAKDAADIARLAAALSRPR